MYHKHCTLIVFVCVYCKYFPLSFVCVVYRILSTPNRLLYVQTMFYTYTIHLYILNKRYVYIIPYCVFILYLFVIKHTQHTLRYIIKNVFCYKERKHALMVWKKRTRSFVKLRLFALE